MPQTSEYLLDMMRQEQADYKAGSETHHSRLIEAMKLALESTEPGKAGYPNAVRRVFEPDLPEMI